MAARQWRWLILILVLAASLSLMGCAEEGPKGEPGPSGPPGQPGEVVIVRPPEEPAPLPPETGLTPRQAQPRVSFAAADLPAGIQQVELVAASPARLRVAFRLTNDLGEPIERTALEPLRFTLSYLQIDPVTGLTHWRSAIFRTQESPITGLTVQQPSDETGGTFEDLGNGIVRYTFATALPDGFDPSATHRVGVQAIRSVDDREFVDNATLDFRPDGGPVILTREVVRTANCQRCHEPFAFHGGLRTEVKVCVQCHTPQNTDPDTLDPIPDNPVNPHFDPAAAMQPLPNPIDFKIMIHRIHQGKVLREEAGITYQVIGFRQTVADFSEVAFPQDIRNCTTCHTGTTEASNFKTAPSRAACGSCHVRTWFGDSQDTPAELEPHPGGPQPDDTQCTRCHTAEGVAEFDLSVEGAHTNPLRSVQAPGVNFAIVRVEDAEDGDQRVDPGHHPRVVFNITDDMGHAIPPASMDFLRLTLAGPTTDYRTQDYDGDGQKTPGEPLRGAPFTTPGEDFMQLDARDASGPDADGNFSSTFVGPIMVGNDLTITDAAIPRDARGTYAVGIEGYRCVRIDGLEASTGGLNCTPGNTAFDEIRDAGPNVVAYFAVTDPEPVLRRLVVDAATRCITCHGVFSKDFSVHGNIRNNTEYCVMCHNPSHDTLGRQPPPAPDQTALTFPVNFKVMVHKIHRGHDLTQDYALFSFSGARIDVREFHFPGDLRDCQTCHITDAEGDRTELLIAGKGVLGDDVQPTIHRRIDAGKDIVATFATPPITSACTACHDQETTVAHAELNTTPAGVETCEVCHGAGKEFAVERVHAR
jgi:OmcA/MtrC family decaheme c-type cytochrome